MEVPDGLIGYATVAVGSVLAPTWLGFELVRSLGLTRAHGLRTAWAYGLLVGMFAMAACTWLWLWCERPCPGQLLGAAALAAAAVLRWRRARHDPPAPPSRGWLQGGAVWLPLLLALLPIADLITRANVQPIVFGDESLIWAAKAKVWFAAPAAERLAMMHDVAHADYPMFNPLLQALAFASGGRVMHWENRLPLQAAALALLVLLSAATTRRSHPAAAAAMLLLFAGIPAFHMFTGSAVADILLGIATLACVDALLRARETGEAVWWRLATIAGGAMLASKNEGVLIVLAIGAAFGAHWLLRQPKRWPAVLRALPWLAVPAVVYAVHAAANASFGVHNDLTADPEGRGLLARVVHQFGSNASTVASYAWNYCIDGARSRWLLPATALATVTLLAWRRRRALDEPALMPATVALMVCAGYCLVFIGTTAADLGWHLGTAFDRILLHVLPLAALAMSMLVWPRQQPDDALDRGPRQQPEMVDGDRVDAAPHA